MAEINTLGYSTHVLGTVKSVMDCLKIVLYSRYDFLGNPKYSKISLYNLQEDFVIVMASNKKIVLERNNNTEDFHYKHTDSGLSGGFNIIVYVNASTNAPIGYTEFSNTQGEGRDIDIKLDLKAEVTSEGFDVILKDSLSAAPYAKVNYLGKEQNKYTAAETVLDELETIQPENKYTKYLSQVMNDSESNDVLDTGLVKKINGGVRFAKLNIVRNLNYNPLNYNFTNYNISNYGNDIVLGYWNGTNYCIASLMMKNSFGSLIIYTKSNKGYYTLPDDGTVDTINYIAGKYIVCTNTNASGRQTPRIFNVETRKWKSYSDRVVFIDPEDPECKVRVIPISFPYEKAYSILPEVSNVYYNFLEGDQVSVLRKIGSWIFFSWGSLVLASSTALSIYMTQDEFKRVMVVNDNSLIIKDTNSYRLYKGIAKTYYTSGAATQETPASPCEVIDSTTELYKTPFNLLRRGPYMDFTGVPNIVATYKGHLFYTDDNYINFL